MKASELIKSLIASPGIALSLRIVALVCVCSIATLMLGKDSNWDLFNYHLYIAHAVWTQDLQSDFMAASVPRYFNPIGYLPFYWMIQAGWHSLSIGFALAAFHSLAFTLLWQICARFLFKNDARAGLLATVAVALAAMTPVFLGTLGGTYLDPVTLVFVFGGLLLLCCELERSSPTILLPLFAGLLIGIAAALKLTNVIYVAGAGGAILVATRFKARGWRAATCYGIGAIIGAIIAGGWWSLQLFREFGNPFFPLFNEYFQSPDFPPVRLSHERYKPASLLDAIAFPFDLVRLRPWFYVENAAPDARFALLAMVALVLLAVESRRRLLANALRATLRNIPAELIICFFLMSIPVWMATSSNGRYALPILLLVAPILILAVRTASPDRKWFASLILLIFLIQGAVMSRGGNPRVISGKWSSNWIDFEMPAKLKDHPYGYMSIGPNSLSFTALKLHPNSRLVSVLGAYPLSIEGYGGHRVRTFIAAHAGRLRTLGSLDASVYRSLLEKNSFDEYLKDIDGRFAMLDLRTDSADCVPIQFSVGNAQADNAILISCALLPGNPLRADTVPVWERISHIFDRIQSACPALFSPNGIVTTKRGEMWYRLYLNTDVMLHLINGRISYTKSNGPFEVDMGTPEDWEAGTAKWECKIPPPHWKFLPAK